ncbi:MAG: LamG-like jellyroll fold domain-containing protein, partial [Bdellovibrionota bacterium]
MKKSPIKPIVFVLGLSLLVIAFQNCTANNAHEFSSPSTNSTSLSMTGNGGTYDGKPEVGTYVRRSDSTCSAQTDLIGFIDVAAFFSTVTSDLCVPMSYDIAFGDSRFEFSFYNRDFVGMNSAIFEKAKNETPLARGKRVDLWCRYNDPQFGLDVVVKTDPVSGASESIVYVGENLSSPQPSSRKSNTLPSTTASGAGRFTSTSSDGTVKVDIDVSTAIAFKHPGRVEVELDGKQLDLAVDCRVADTKPAVHQKPSNVFALFQMDGALGLAANGSAINDSSQAANNVSLSNADLAGAQYVNGLKGAALSFDGVDSNVDLSSLATAGDFSFSAWVLPSPTIGDSRPIFGIFNTSDSANYPNTLRVGLGLCKPTPDETVDRTHLTMDIETVGPGGDFCYDLGVIVDGAWHMVTFTFSGGQVYLFKDGVLVQNGSVTSPLLASDKCAL